VKKLARSTAAEALSLARKFSILTRHGLSHLCKWILYILEWIFILFLLVLRLEIVEEAHSGLWKKKVCVKIKTSEDDNPAGVKRLRAAKGYSITLLLLYVIWNDVIYVLSM
jgi:hypothetical protein